MSSSNRPEWSVYLTNTSAKHMTSTGDVNTLLICLVFILLRTIIWWNLSRIHQQVMKDETKYFFFLKKVLSNKLRSCYYWIVFCKYNLLFDISCRMNNCVLCFSIPWYYYSSVLHLQTTIIFLITTYNEIFSLKYSRVIFTCE